MDGTVWVDSTEFAMPPVQLFHPDARPTSPTFLTSGMWYRLDGTGE